MPASLLLTTPEKLKRYLNLPQDDTSVDDALKGPIAAVSEAIELYCRRRFARTEIEEDYDGTGHETLNLRRRPVAEIAAVWEDPLRVFAAGTELPADAYVCYPDEGVLRRVGARFPEGAQNIRVRYTAGYGTIPPVLEQAANSLAAHYYLRGRQGGDGVSAESLGGYSVNYDATDWPASAKTLLAEFREI